MIYGLPHTFQKLSKSMSEDGKEGWSPAAGVFFGALFEVPGVFLAILLAVTISRKSNMVFAFVMSTICLSLASYALVEGMMDTWGVFAIFGAKMFIASGFIVVYLYLLECYPTLFRATGLAFCMVTGRLGAFLCPFLYDGLYYFTK